MFIFLALILTIISIGLRLTAGSMWLSSKIVKRVGKLHSATRAGRYAAHSSRKKKLERKINKFDTPERVVAKAGVGAGEVVYYGSDVAVSTGLLAGRYGLYWSSKFLKLLAIAVRLMRDFMVWVAGFILVLDIVVFLLIAVSASGFLVLYTEVSEETGSLAWKEELNLGGNSTSSVSSGSSDSGSEDDNNTSNTGTLTVDMLLSKAKIRADYVRDNHFKYGNATKNPSMDDSEHLVSCDRFVQWVLYDCGLTDQPETSGLVVKSTDPTYDLSTWLEKHGFTKITNMSDVQPGDIIFQNMVYSTAHVYILGNKVDDINWQRFDCGSDRRIQSTQPSTEAINSTRIFSWAYRMPGA